MKMMSMIFPSYHFSKPMKIGNESQLPAVDAQGKFVLLNGPLTNGYDTCTGFVDISHHLMVEHIQYSVKFFFFCGLWEEENI